MLRVLGKLIVIQLDTSFPTFYITQILVTAVTRVHQWPHP